MRNGKNISAKDLSSDETTNLVKKYRAIIQSVDSTSEEKLQARLAFLAVAREAMYRATGKMPRSTQILSVLNAMQQGKNVLSQIATGEGKSITTALFAALLSLEGGAVDVCTSNSELARVGLKENAVFFDYLGINHSKKNITVNSKAGDYVEEGVNYSDVEQLSLSRLGSQFESKPRKNARPPSLVLDEADFSILDDSTKYRYAPQQKGVGGLSADAWIYTALNDFVDSPLFQDKTKTANQDIQYAIEYLKKVAHTPEQRTRLEYLEKELDHKTLDTWLDSAVTASRLKENTHYVVQQEEKENKQVVSIARLLIQNRVSVGPQFSNGVHQFLHARLEKKRKSNKTQNTISPFEITPEAKAIASNTSKNFINYYRKAKGYVWGMTGTLGSAAERNEYREKYGFKMQRIPQHTQANRKDLTKLVKDDNAYRDAIRKEIVKRMRNRARVPGWRFWRRYPPQPILIVCKDIDAANEMHRILSSEMEKYLKKYPCHLQLYNGKDTVIDGHPALEDEKTEESVKDRAGIAGWITITTPILGRGTDFKPRLKESDKDQNHPNGLFVLQTFLASERTTGQIVGRANRQGYYGDTLLLINRESLLPGKTANDQLTATRQKDEKLTAWQRQIREEQSDTTNLFFRKIYLII